jgi:hypothetical protein
MEGFVRAPFAFLPTSLDLLKFWWKVAEFFATRAV